MKFDSNLAWQNASAAIAANREAVFALAGVFFLLPSLATALLFPPPEPVAGMDGKAALAAMSGYYTSILPFLVPMVLFQAAGTLALLTMLTDRTRPTVGEAIGIGLRAVVPYVLAQLILGIAAGVIGGIILAIGAATGLPVLTAIGAAVVIALFIYAAIKTSLVAPVVAVEGERNPVAALKRSWLLTKGNSVRLAVFYLLVLAAFLIITMVLTAVLGIVAAAIGGSQAAEMTGAVVSSVLNAVMALYFVAIVAAGHRQLAGPTSGVVSATFD
jgi:ABC-type multidrug transport system fused ATPase/permease subunit